MDEHRGDRQGKGDHGHGEGPRGGGEDRRGPPGTDWLDLEMSKVLQGAAERLARGAAEEILKDAIKARLLERLGPRLEAIGRLVADQLADDVEANLDIEARIAARREARRLLDGRIAEALGHPGERPRDAPGEPREPREGE